MLKFETMTKKQHQNYMLFSNCISQAGITSATQLRTAGPELYKSVTIFSIKGMLFTVAGLFIIGATLIAWALGAGLSFFGIIFTALSAGWVYFKFKSKSKVSEESKQYIELYIEDKKLS